MSIKNSIEFVQRGLAFLIENECVRDIGNQRVHEIKAEIDTVLANYVEATATPAPVVQTVMTEGQVNTLIEAVAARANTGVDAVLVKVNELFDSSDLQVLDAIASSRADVLAALVPPAVV
jgi:hypothetical protein